jgi:hypothetical protein
MIGVAAGPKDRDAAKEFFELCKTPWEFCRSDGQYEVLLCTTEPLPTAGPRLVLVFSGTETPSDQAAKLAVKSRVGGSILTYAGRRLPVYGPTATFATSPVTLVTESETHEPAVHARRTGGTTTVRVGFNLFEETRFLLTMGQPAANAGAPTLELHIALLRDLITRAGLPFVEIPPVPDGHACIACLTHDVDHPALRKHCCDHTMLGFLYRATIGSLVDLCHGRKSARHAWHNWMTAVRLPLVYLGWIRDPWDTFDRYLQMEAGRHSTFFFIPQKGHPGRRVSARKWPRRASRYDLSELALKLKGIVAAGSEVAVHGLDAWLDAADGRREREQVAQVARTPVIGVRMHWLCFDQDSPAALDRAGFSYDSTFGYNDAVGYRAGTLQAYRPLGTTNLLELPLHVMDTALFFRTHLNLAEDEACRVVRSVMDDVVRFGGALTINWHDRSLAPERLWGECYLIMLRELNDRGAWFATGAQAADWFRMRRAAVLEFTREESGLVRVNGRTKKTDRLPGLRIRVHKPLPRTPTEPLAPGTAAEFVDERLIDTAELAIAI